MKETSFQLGEEGIDWSAVCLRMEEAQDMLKRGWAPTKEKKTEVLHARARTLALEAEPKKNLQESLEVVEFLLAYERYGIDSCQVREVYPLRELTPLPCTPPFVMGIINVRGQILTVIDVKKFFNLPEKGLTDLNKVIIVQAGGVELGILADAVLGMRFIQRCFLQPSLPTLTGIRAEYLTGITADRLAVLNVDRILSDKNIVVEEEVRD